MRKLFRISAICLSALFLISCVKQEQVNLLERRLSDQEQQILALNNSMGSTSKELENVRPGQADLWSELKAMRVAIATMEGQIEDLQAETSSAASTEAEVAELKQRIAQLENSMRMMSSQLGVENTLPAAPTQPTAAVPPSVPAQMQPDQNGKVTQQTPPVASAPATTPQNVAPEDLAEALYKNALEAFNDRRYKDAQRMWSEYEKTYPKSKLVANAAFWQGEAYYQMNDYARAVLAYQSVLDKYSKSNKYPQALLKQGISFIKLGKKDAGKLRLTQLVQKYPKSVEATRAKQELAKTK